MFAPAPLDDELEVAAAAAAAEAEAAAAREELKLVTMESTLSACASTFSLLSTPTSWFIMRAMASSVIVPTSVRTKVTTKSTRGRVTE